ncbi:hypothetical protein F4778DRAFT_613623 [Xylariomycetidae sp. FL2044]|nr:hypothetical protein F4778DRAFT_613623 [Xylariomycetidae sp. FL2044]
MDGNAYQPEISAEIPLLSLHAIRLVRDLDAGASLDSLFTYVKEMARAFHTEQNFLSCPKTLEAFQDNTQTQREIQALFHTIPRPTLRSLVLGLLPHDLHDDDSANWANIYHPTGPGTYLIGISIRGRRGAFLSQVEIHEVIHLLNSYKVACEAWKTLDDADSWGQSQLTDWQEACLALAMRIDNHMMVKRNEWNSGRRFEKPRCFSGRTGLCNLEALIASLRNRLSADYDQEVYQLTAPAYVGCSHRVKKRAIHHDPDYGNLSGSSSMLKLLLCCIGEMGLRPQVHTIPIVMVWEENQIQLSEILVHVLAQSLVSLNGLNIIQPGTSPIPDERHRDLYDATKHHVWFRRLFLKENIILSLTERQRTDILRDTLDGVQRYQMVHSPKSSPKRKGPSASEVDTHEDGTKRARRDRDSLDDQSDPPASFHHSVEDAMPVQDSESLEWIDDERFTDNSPIDSDSDNEQDGRKAKVDTPLAQLIGAFKKLPAELQRIAKDQPRKLTRMAEKSEAWIKKSKGSIRSNQDLLEQLFPAEQCLDDLWTRDDELKFQRALLASPYKQYLMVYKPSTSINRFVSMWKRVCRITHRAPPTILCRSNGLEYAATPRITLTDGSSCPDPIWTARFCDKFSKLTIGGPWGNNMALFTLFLRYTVACRINDRRKLLFEHNTESKFMERMQDRLGPNRDPRKSIPKIHQEVRASLNKDGVQLPWYSHMFRKLEQLTYKAEESSDEDEETPYQLTTGDLTVVQRAVSNCKVFGRPMFQPVGDISRVLIHGLGYEYPKDIEDIRALQLAYYEKVERISAKTNLTRLLRAASQSPPDSAQLL